MKQNPSDMEINNNNWEDIDVDEIARRIVVKITPLFKKYLLDLMSNDLPKIEEFNPEQSRDDDCETKVTMNKPESRNVSLIKDLNNTVPELNPTVPLFTAQMLKRGWGTKC